jgi:hypothetical protein
MKWLLLTIVAASTLILAPVAPAQAGENWQITLTAQEGDPGWFRIRAWGQNVSGYDLGECSCRLSVSGNAQIQPNSAGTIYLGDAANGQTLYYEFDIYSRPGGGTFNAVVEFEGYIYSSDVDPS